MMKIAFVQKHFQRYVANCKLATRRHFDKNVGKYGADTFTYKRNKHLLYFGLWYIIFMLCFYALYTINDIVIIDSFHKTLIDIGFNLVKFISIGIFILSITNGLLGLYYAIRLYLEDIRHIDDTSIYDDKQ